MTLSRWLLPVAALVGALVGAGVMWTAGGSRAATEQVIHDYLLAHPEVIPEAMSRLQDQENGKQVAAYRTAIETPVGSAWAGNPKGDVTLVEYYDYNCGYCRASLPAIAALLRADRNVRIVYQELPVLAESSRDAARLSLVAAQQGKFQAFHDALYAAGPVSPATLAAAASRAGIDMGAARAQQGRADAAIRTNLQLAQRLGMSGTPSWVIGNRMISGALSLEQLQDAVAEARRHA